MASYAVTGTLAPDATGLYVEYGTYGGDPTYKLVGGEWYLWHWVSGQFYYWYITTEIGYVGGVGWRWLFPNIDDPPDGDEYYGVNGAGGTPAVVTAVVATGTLLGGKAAASGLGTVSVSGTGSVAGSQAAASGVGAVAVSGAGILTGAGSRAAGRDFYINTGRLVGAGSTAVGVATGPVFAAGVLLGGKAAASGVGAVAVSGAGRLLGGEASMRTAASVTTLILLDGRGLYRIFNDAEYWFYWGAAPPDESAAADETNPTLPYTTTQTWAGTQTVYLALQWFNGVIASGFFPIGPNGEYYLRLDLDTGAEVGSPPQGPIDWRLEVRAGGVIRVHALIYVTDSDADPDTWAIAYTVDAGDPVEDTPDLTQAFRFGLGVEILAYDLPAQAEGAVVKVRLQTQRSSDSIYSDDSTVLEAVAEVVGPDAVLAVATWPGSLPEDA